ncbi:hypothetical protein MMRN_41820 [Mycobacterium marinum]|uniref:hypothetical protein n=1 Tax=Mycobacterium marinum TaxID=1781 RepID=UPI000DC6E46C|nr:hypothetical protein [Mycobacterium marinum]WOR03257.1 hypothetical protein QDR78_18945 [Mycobacterium marinum]BBC67286.1 hypothetical protein MMRN_41820 [Mycobacterium marinum]
MSDDCPYPSHPTLVCLVLIGDEVAIPIQPIREDGVHPVEYFRGQVTALGDDEPNRQINMQVRFPDLKQTMNHGVKPGDLVHRLNDIDESRFPVYVRGVDLWKFEGLWLNDPERAGQVQLVRVDRGPHPDDGREILGMEIEDSQGQRRRIFTELDSGMVVEHR